MTGIARNKASRTNYPGMVIALLLAMMLILPAGCTDSSEKNGSSQQKSNASGEQEHPLIGTWVSQKSPDKKFIFTEDSVTYKELGYSVLLEETGKYKLERDGTIEWSITWYSGGVTRWNGMLEDEKITVEYVNSWDGSQGKDILTKTQQTD